jgi:transposase-like protein
MANTPTTLQEAIIHFSDLENCRAYMIALRWPDGKVRCPNCGKTNVDWLPNAGLFKCYEKHPRQKFSLKIGTVFEDSPIPLAKWLPCVWQVVNCKNGISSWEIHRALGVTQKTAWFMIQRVRLALQDEVTGGKLGGDVEVDETYIGGKARNMHKDVRRRKITKPGPHDKVPVRGILKRGGKVRTFVIPDNQGHNLKPLVHEHVEAGAAIFTDNHHGYHGLAAEFEYQVVDHAIEYVRGNVHTNGLENFWSLLKRGLHGTYLSVEPFHLFRYVDEQPFRYNTRKNADGDKITDGERFNMALSKIVGKRLTYAQLTGKELVRSNAE